MMKTKFSALKWFALGLGSELQLIASLSISEMIIFCTAPFIAFRYMHMMKRDGVFFFFVLSIALVIGAAIACVNNSTPIPFVIRGMAVTTLIPCAIVVAYYLLLIDPGGFKWYLVGIAISMVLCTFIFQKSVEIDLSVGRMVSSETSSLIMQSSTYWAGRLFPVLTLWTKGWYLHSPILWDVIIMGFLLVFSMISTTSGRSTALGCFVFLGLIILGGKRQKTMMRISRWFFLLIFVGILGIFSMHKLYVLAATRGYLGNEAADKYEQQTKGVDSVGRLILGGRMESFCGLIACVDKPFIGFGPWAIDYNGYTGEFLSKYADESDYVHYLNKLEFYRQRGENVIGLIPCHSHITQFWCWYGICGLMFWIYVIFVIIRYLKQDCWSVPQWYGWLACSSAIVLWKICFSPFSDRVGIVLFVVACLVARAIRMGRRQLPLEMIEEIK